MLLGKAAAGAPGETVRFRPPSTIGHHKIRHWHSRAARAARTIIAPGAAVLEDPATRAAVAAFEALGAARFALGAVITAVATRPAPRAAIGARVGTAVHALAADGAAIGRGQDALASAPSDMELVSYHLLAGIHGAARTLTCSTGSPQNRRTRGSSP